MVIYANNYICHVMIKQIMTSDVKRMAREVAKHYTLVNMNTYFVITDNRTNETTSYTYDTNYVYLRFSQEITGMYLTTIMEDWHYLSWRRHGFNLATDRQRYVDKIFFKVVEILCGYKPKQ